MEPGWVTKQGKLWIAAIKEQGDRGENNISTVYGATFFRTSFVHRQIKKTEVPIL